MIPLTTDERGCLQLPVQFAGRICFTIKEPKRKTCRDDTDEVVLPVGGRPAIRQPKYPRAQVGAEGGAKKHMSSKRSHPHPMDVEHVERIRIREVALSQETQGIQRDEAEKTISDQSTVYWK